jgi:MFS family permease
VDNVQLNKIAGINNSVYWEANYTVENNEYDSFSNTDVPQQYTVQDYSANILYNKNYAALTAEEQQAAKDWYVNLTPTVTVDGKTQDTTYYYDSATDVYSLSEQANGRSYASYLNVVNTARSQYATEVTAGQSWVLILFIIVLLLTLMSMATFRSPAVALMPDVTVKPLRSKGNAIINLLGAGGGMLVLVLGMVFGTGKVVNQIMSYTGYVLTVCGIMAAALVAFMLLVKEKAWNNEMLATQAQLDAAEAAETAAAGDVPAPKSEKLTKPQFISLLLILASVALWFIGYNAVTSKFSLYSVNVLAKDFNSTLIVAQGAAIVSYIPVGILATKLGRKRTILIGVALLALSFGGAIFVNSGTSAIVMNVLFALAGIAWATINVNSFPMVVELSQGGSIGKYTGYYYTASMAAQILTPILSGALMDAFGTMKVLFPYAVIFVALSFVTMLFVKHGDSKPAPKDKLEMIGDVED